MTREKAIFLAVAQTLADNHVNVNDVFDNETEKEYANNLINKHENEIGNDDNGDVIDTYKDLAKTLIQDLIRKRELNMRFHGEDWGSAYAEFGEIIKRENYNE